MAACFPPYGSMRQQDAHEFLGDLLNKLQEELFPFARRYAARALAVEAQKKEHEAAVASAAGVAAAAVAGGGKKGGAKGQQQQQQQLQGGGQTKIRAFFTRKPSMDPSVPASMAAGAGAAGAVAAGQPAVALEETVSEAEAAVLETVLPVTRHFHSEVGAGSGVGGGGSATRIAWCGCDVVSV